MFAQRSGAKGMDTYYTGKHATSYNSTWQTFSQKTLVATLSAIDIAGLQQKMSTQGRVLRILDVACGTGLLLEQFSRLFPQAELYGIDASQDMLTQAACLLQGHPTVSLVQTSLASGETANLPYPPAFFDLITCTNTLHYFNDPLALLKKCQHQLALGGQLVIEDYVLRGFPFTWKAFERAIKTYDSQHVRLHTLAKTQIWCQQAGFQVVHTQTFHIDLFC